MLQAHVYISGFVQAVGFRQFIKVNADKLKLDGWVRNLPDGRVEAVLQGRKEDVEKIILLCRKGPFLAEVETLDFNWEKVEEEFASFEVVI